jgi:hypothetical protein
MNWDDILKEQESDPGFAPVPAGKYPVVVDNAEAVVASTGADMLKVQLSIEGGPFDSKKVFTNIVFTKNNPKAMRFTLRKLDALGVTREILANQNPAPSAIAAMITGVRCEADVTIRPASDEWEASNDVKALRKVGLSAVPDAPAPGGSGSTPPAPPQVPPAPTIPTPPADPEPDPATAAADAPEGEEDPF